MKRFLVSGVFLILLSSLALAGVEARYFPAPATTADHSKYQQLQGPFKRPEEVTKACLTCHVKAGQQVKKTLHWTWNWPGPNGRKLGKAHVINNF